MIAVLPSLAGTNTDEVPMPTRTTATRTRPIAARCFALAAFSVTYLLTGCEADNTALHSKVDAGKAGGQDAGGKEVATGGASGGTGGGSGTGGSGAGGKTGTGGSSGTGGTGGTGAGGKTGTGGSSGTGGNTSLPATACTAAGGACVAVAPGTCATGILSSLSCGSGVGTTCCMPGGAGGSGGAGGGTGRGGNNGAGGKNGTGGNSCTESGGTCVGVLPGSCASGIMNSSLFCGDGVGSACCLPGGGGGRGGNSGAAGQGGHAAGGANGQGGTGGRGTEPQAADCEKAGGICTEQGTCASQGGTVAVDSPAGCHFGDVTAECCIAPAPKPNPTTCAEAGGTCTSVSGCLMAGGYFTASNYNCTFPGTCCVSNATCGTANIDCCGDGVIYTAACQGGQFVCVVGSPVPRGTCKI